MKQTFLLSDESVNSYGLIVKTNGIDLSRFKKNPVMFFNHDRELGIIGRWENIRVEGVQLLADAVFDENTPLGLNVKQRTESGFLRATSIGIEIVSSEEIDGIENVVKSVLAEVSIVDVPANPNTVKTLRNNAKSLFLSYQFNTSNKQDLKQLLIDLLELNTDVSDMDIVEVVKSLVFGNKNTTSEALRLGYISEKQKQAFSNMEKHDKAGFCAFMEDKRNQQKEAVRLLVWDNVGKGKVTPYEKEVFEDVGALVGLKLLRKLFQIIPDRIKITDLITGGKDCNRNGWGLNEYRKYAPEELRDNPELYNRLLSKEGGEVSHSLDWYRRNNPEYLRNNPNVYKHLANK